MPPKTDYALLVWNQGIYRGFALGGKVTKYVAEFTRPPFMETSRDKRNVQVV